MHVDHVARLHCMHHCIHAACCDSVVVVLQYFVVCVLCEWRSEVCQLT